MERWTDRQTDNIINNRRRRNTVKRAVALLSVLVLLLTANTLKLHADTLERVAMCGILEHTHTEACYNARGRLVCAREEHVHTDACFQQRPVRSGLKKLDAFLGLNARVRLTSSEVTVTADDIVQAPANDWYSDIVDGDDVDLAGEQVDLDVEEMPEFELGCDDEDEETALQIDYSAQPEEDGAAPVYDDEADEGAIAIGEDDGTFIDETADGETDANEIIGVEAITNEIIDGEINANENTDGDATDDVILLGAEENGTDDETIVAENPDDD